MNNRYFLLRHGENVYQVEKKRFIYPLKDSRSVKLTKKGKNQVRKSLKEIKKENIDLIYSSDFYRTKETAKIASRELNINKINFDKRLRDINMGVFHGKEREEYSRFFNYKKRKFSKKPPKGESWSDLKKRMRDFLKNIDKKYKKKKILIVSHGDPLWILEGIIKGMNNQELLKEIFTKKTQIKVSELRKVN
ncbi:MAG TPA: histidine phosphatase family protein [Candidatus Paceibacterota bacterium]|nr:histidine phosphatase family protein [Candidatus Paceibacterota bacterium]